MSNIDDHPDAFARVAHAIRWRRKRLWRRSFGRRAYARQLEEKALRPTVGNAQRLMTNPTSTQLVAAGAMLDSILERPEPPGRITLELIVDQAIETLRETGDHELAIERVQRVAREHPARALTQTRRFIEHLRDTNRRDSAAALAQDLATTTTETGYGTILHQLQLGAGDVAAADHTIEAVAARLGEDHPTPLLMRAEELLGRDQNLRALDTLREIRPGFTRQYSKKILRALTGIGEYRSVLEYLDSYDSGLTEIQERVHRFDAHFSLGERDLAEAQLAVVGNDDPDEAFASRLVKAFGPDAGKAYLQGIASVDLTSELDPERLEQVGIVLFRSNDAAGAVDVLRRADQANPLTPVARQALAQSLYSMRSFEEALVEIDRLMDTERHWAAMKLKGRVLIQLGRPADALENRLRYGRPDDATDQVRYHALLSLGRYDEAFRLHPFIADLRSLQSVFGDRAEHYPSQWAVNRFVIADAGPGDDIQDASLYDELLAITEHLSSTCDPRLQTLLERSFPQMSFTPVERLRDPPHFSSHGPRAEPRAGNPLDRLLTQHASDVAATHDRVLLGRAIKNVRDLRNGPKPKPAFLCPDPNRVATWRNSTTADRPLVGLVWRSELQTSWRAVHYVGADDLGPLSALDATFICLQHDATEDERSSLEAAFGQRIQFVDNVDLRNDFEEAAALLSTLDLTVGVGTTMTNLAAAVGCPTLMMQPSHFGSWLATNSGGSDFWYESCIVVVADPPYDTVGLIARTTELASRELSDKSRFAS